MGRKEQLIINATAKEDIYYDALCKLIDNKGDCSGIDCDDCPLDEMYSTTDIMHLIDDINTLMLYKYKLALRYAYSKRYITEAGLFELLL